MIKPDMKPVKSVQGSPPDTQPFANSEPDSLLARMRALKDRINPRSPPTLVSSGAQDGTATAVPPEPHPVLSASADTGQVRNPEEQLSSGIGLAFDQKRETLRNRCLRSAKVVFHNRRYQVNCQIRDESNSGMKLRLLGDVAVPDRFELLIESKEELLPVIVRWRSDLEIGVEVAGEPTPLPPRLIMDTSRRI
ncbi:MAG: PilZ domain-containing protein [Anderseniella sp.]